MDLKTPVSQLFMVGPTYARRLKKLNITTLGDLLYHFPHRYEDLSLISKINQLQPGEKVTLQGKIKSIKNQYLRSGRKIQKAVVADSTGEIEVTWFNQPFLAKTLKPNTLVSLAGKVDLFGQKKTLTSPDYELVKTGKTVHTGRLVPIYPETYGISSKWLRSRIYPLISKIELKIEEFLPSSIVKRNDFPDLNKALEDIHFPKSLSSVQKARERFAFEELLLMHLETLLRKEAWKKTKLAHRFSLDQEKILAFISSLPFHLTQAQKKVIKEILTDLAQEKPMNRLLEGDVGSGKTVVSAIAVYAAYLNNYQSAFMAPTEILAQQHSQTLKTLLEPLGIKISLLTGSIRKKQADFDLIIGTHALIYRRAKFDQLGLVIIDEQHRFGVEQRSQLIHQTDHQKIAPHFLTMTATPIPRTIALTLYGDLDLSVIDELPPGRVKIKTWAVPQVKREGAYAWIKKQIQKGDQAFIICPLIEESTAETLSSVKAVKTEFEKLQKEVFSKLKLGLLHGRLKSKEKDQVLARFRQGKIDILVSTPVVEVGIDIPNATIMMVEAADRFGLAQLHQLRGRVGRGKKQSYCLLFSEKTSKRAWQRLRSLEKDLTGAELAEVDLKMRGPGELYGLRQHGFIKFKVASFSDTQLIAQTKKEAQKIISRLNRFPRLKEKLKEAKIRNIEPN